MGSDTVSEMSTGKENPLIVSVDDHVVEPPHLFERWLPAKFKSHPDVPRIERRGLAGMKYLGASSWAIRTAAGMPNSPRGWRSG